jgi:hypothetical protein
VVPKLRPEPVRAALVAIAACVSAPAPVEHPAPPGSCPGAGDVYIVQYDPDVKAWRLPLRGELGPQGVEPGLTVLDAATALAAGIPAPPPKLWVFAKGPPCEATPAAAYRQIIIEGPISMTYGVQLETRCVAEYFGMAVAIAADSPPAGCTLAVEDRVAARLAEQGPPDEHNDGPWSVQPAAAPIPEALAKALPAQKCAPPCEALWTVDAFEVAGKPVAWEIVQSFVTPTSEPRCNWDQRNGRDTYLATAAGVRPLATGILHAFAILADTRGPRVFVGTNLGEYATYDLDPAPAERRHLKFMTPNEEDYASQGVLGPYCGP